VENDKTDKNDLIRNGEFMLAVFGDELTDARPLVVSCDGDPASVHSKVWLGKPWRGAAEVSTSWPACSNN
jgi:hypothetical protein